MVRKKIGKWIIFILFTAICPGGRAIGAAANTGGGNYVINGIKVYSKANSTNEAKELAIKDGERRALKGLFGKIGINPVYTKYVNENALADMVSSIRISEEVMAKNTYSGVLTVIFDREFVRYNLENLGIKSKKPCKDVILYIPLFIREGSSKPTVLDSSNTWYRAAYNRFFEKEFEDIFIVDNYSLSNSGLLTDRHIKTLNYTSFETLLSKYASNVVMLAIAKYNREADRVDVILKEITAEDIDEKFLNYINKEGLPVDTLLEKASVQLLNSIEETQINRRVSVRESVEGPREDGKQVINYIDVLIPVPNLREFIFIKNLVKNFNFLTKVESLVITTRMATMRMYFDCYEDELTQFFREKRLILYYMDNQYFLKYDPS
ncbi:MAG: hypothetical protein LBB24_01585 [Rickettsiales bacterium]|jgi:hypothetical protein|nr:hypothetical protein [Rickettsiales bacterium]